MPKKKESFWSFLKPNVVSGLVVKIKKIVEEATHSIQESVHRTIVFALKKISATALILLGVVFFLVGLADVIEELLTLPKGMGYILIGLVIAIIGFILNTFTRR